SAIPLLSAGGRADADGLRPLPGDYAGTPILACCPFFAEIVDSFRCTKQRVRLMRLAAGANIHEHRDSGESWALGQVRLHIPVVTHEEVHFYLDGRRAGMRPGELWYCDFTRPHWVQNRSPIDRVHLVLDLKLNAWLRCLFPEETLAERVGNWVQRCRHHGWQTARVLTHATGLDTVRRLLR